MNAFPVRIDAWQTEDGRIFSSDTAAEWHQKDIDLARFANAAIDSGGNLADVLQVIDQPWPIEAEREILSLITKDTKLIIRHWQCRDEAGYSLVRREVGGGFFVHGHAGCWSGPYGAVCSVSDIVRYAQETLRVHKGVLPTRSP